MPNGNPFTSATAPSYSMLAPDLTAQQVQLTRQQQLADMLRQQALTPNGDTQVIGGWAVKKSPFEGAVKMAQALLGNSKQNDIDAKQIALAKALQQRMGGAFDSMAGGNSAPDPSTPLGPAVAPPDQSAPPAPSGTGADPSQPPGQPSGVTTSSVQDPSAPASAAPAAAPAPQPPQQMSPADRIRNQAKAAYLMGNTELANKLIENISTLTEGQKTDNYLGISTTDARAAELGKRMKDGYIAPTSLRGQAYMTANGKISTLPDAAQPGYMNKFDQATGQWSTVPVQGGIDSVQESTRASALGKTMGTLGQGVDSKNLPAYFLGIPPGATGAPPTKPDMPSVFVPPTAGPTPRTGGINEGNIRKFAGIGADGLASNSPSPDIPVDPNMQMQLQADITRAQGGQPPTAPSTPTVIRPGNAPGQAEFMQASGVAAGKRANDLISTAADSPTRINVLDNIIGLSKNGVDSGPTADWANKVKGIMASVPGFSGWKDDVTGFQELKKYMNQNGLRAWQAAGGSGTDSQLSAAMAANSNDKMFPKAVQTMANWSKAGELALQGKANASQVSGGTTPQDQARFESTWRQNMDPRIYQLKLMDAPEAQIFITNLKKTDPASYAGLVKKAQVLKQLGGL